MPTHYLLVDGYNVIYSNQELAVLAEDNIDSARVKLCDALCEFKALSRYRIMAIFDAHLVPGGEGSVTKYRNIKVVFTKEAETADHYIERAAYRLAQQKDRITVATSDTLEQLIILGRGAARISSEDLWVEIISAKEEARARYNSTRPIKRNPIESLVDEETAKILEAMRYGK